ncbi:MAG: fructose-bisphosphate aldolase [Actinomycetota bacterium]|nr:fructose-bisphosphate aldolase [Actinomycetota bacterium]
MARATKDTAARAQLAESAVRRRNVRRLWAIPGTRLGVVAWPAAPLQRLFWRWHFWWQAHLLDCLVDAQLRDPRGDAASDRQQTIVRLIRGHRLRNGGRWGNDYYDDIAWWALALQRAGAPGVTPDLDLRGPVSLLAGRIERAWSEESGGGIPWRRGDVFRNTPANGPAAILLARTGNQSRAAATADWIDQRLRITTSNLIADGMLPGGDAGGFTVDETIYTYSQGVVLGAELELVCSTDRDASRIHRLVAAVHTELAPGGVLMGHGGGNGGLFTGILARYLAQVATRLPGSTDQDRLTRTTAARLVSTAADAAWHHAIVQDDLPIFGADWSVEAIRPRRGGTGAVHGNAVVGASRESERDLSVQLSGWMLMEAAALIAGSTAASALDSAVS